LPGNGSLVAALEHATGVKPIVTGKPDPTMHRESVQRSGARTPIVVGDRLDTDIEGASAVGCDSLLVLSGVTSAAELLAAPVGQRPTFIAADLGGLLVAHEQPAIADRGAVCGAWRVGPSESGGQRLVLRPHDHPGPGEHPGRDEGVSSDQAVEDLDALRALCAALWSAHDSAEPADAGGAAGRSRSEPAVHVEAGGDGVHARRAAQETLGRLGLSS
jgi:hypothetical protein